MEKVKIVFFGSDEKSMPFLKMLFETEIVLAVITQPDKPKGRGMKIQPTVVKSFALANNIKVFDWTNLNEQICVDEIEKLQPDIGIVVAYGKKIPNKVYLIPKCKTINIHFSLLPRWRGPAPIEYCLLNSDKETGVSIIDVVDEIDAGDILLQGKIGVDENDDIFSLERKLVDLGVKLLQELLEKIKGGETIPRTKQVGTPSFSKLIKKEDARINWYESAHKINQKIKAFKRWPQAYTILKSNQLNLKILESEIVNVSKEALPGEVCDIIKHLGFVVKASEEGILAKIVKPENKKEISAWDFIQGYHIKIGDSFV